MTTNIEAMWPGVWQQDTNGWRVQLYCWTNNSDVWGMVGVGNTITNFGHGFLWTPNEKFAKFELTDSNGVVIPLKNGIVLEDQFPLTINIHAFPRWPNGKLKIIGFFTNSPPWVLKTFRFHDLYQINNEGDYTLTVCVAIYRFGTNAKHFADKIDLPCVSAKIHLEPNQNEK